MVSAARTGTFNYMSDAAQPSLYRNGRVLTRRISTVVIQMGRC